MNAIIFYEHLTREWNAVQSLKKNLESKGFRVKAYSIIFQRTAAWIDALTHRPDVIYLPWFVIGKHETLLDPIMKLAPNAVLINQHQEQITTAGNEHVFYPVTEATKNACYHLAWGDHFRQVLLRAGVRDELIYITGNIRNDAGKADSTMTKQQLAERYGLDANKKWVLFAENRGWLLQRNTEATRKDMMARGVDMADFDESIRQTEKALGLLFDDIRSLGDEFGEKFEFIYRPHPGTRIDAELPAYAHILSDRSIYDWIKNCDLFLTQQSTSIFEAEMCGAPCATIDHMGRVPEEAMVGTMEYPWLTTLREINDDLIARITQEQKAREPIYTRFVGQVDGKACDRTVEATLEILKAPAADKIPMERSTVKQNLRQVAFEVITYIMAKTGLLIKYKFPQSAYVESRDIPFSPENKWIRG